MFFFYIVLIISIILIILIFLTTIQIHIENIKLSTEKNKERNLNKNYKIEIKLYVFKINYMKINITKNKLEKEKVQENINKIREKIKKSKFDIRLLKKMKYLKIKIQRINLKIYIGLENAALNAIIVGILSSIFSIGQGILNDKKIVMYNRRSDTSQENKWKIIPIYQNKNLLNIELNCIINIKMIHIIYTIYKNIIPQKRTVPK